jgi:hypothetical protein
MNTTRWLMVAALGMLGCAGAQAEYIPPPDSFGITLTGFLPGETFDLTSYSTELSTDGYTNYFTPCLPECDPEAHLTIPADATPFDGSASLTADGNGDVSMSFLNVGPTIESLLITTQITGDQLNEEYVCSITENGAPIGFCGFKIASDPQLNTLFEQFGTIGTAVPEPTQYALLLIAFGGVIVAHRIRSQRAGLGLFRRKLSQ